WAALFVGGIIAAIMFVLAIAISSAIGRPVLSETSAHPYKWLFLGGILASVFVQTSVAMFLDNSGLFQCITGAKALGHITNIILASLAGAALLMISHGGDHIYWTIWYLFAVVICDIL